VLEIRDYSGSIEDWQHFVVKVWGESYAGKMLFPLWTPDYFRWQTAMAVPPADQTQPYLAPAGSPFGICAPHCAAAYDGERMVGTILGIPMRFRGPSGEFYGSQGSWLSVDAEYRRHKVATKMRDAVRQRHAQLGMFGQFGFVYFASRSSQGPRFWGSKKISTDFLQKAGFWARVLNPAKASAWSISRWDAFTMSLARLQPRPRFKSKNFEVREFQPGDLPHCVEIVNRFAQNTELSIDWQPASLSVLLSGKPPTASKPGEPSDSKPGAGRSLIAVRGGEVLGVLAYHLLPFQGRTVETIAVIDLIAFGDLKGFDRTRFLSAGLERMAAENAVLALKASFGDYTCVPLWGAGFVPQPAHSHLILTGATEGISLPRVRRSHLIWR